jgi:adenylate cyclase class 2
MSTTVMPRDDDELEVEMKFAEANFGALERQLGNWHARADAPRQDADTYFNTADPHRDFALTDEALRLRQIGHANFVTYKGPKLDAQTKTRVEVEVPLGSGDKVAADFKRVLQFLGYRLVAVVQKQRRIYHLDRGGYPIEVCLDAVEGVGQFAELEILAPRAQLDAARAVLFQTAQELGLKLDKQERRSYLEMLLACRKDQ